MTHSAPASRWFLLALAVAALSGCSGEEGDADDAGASDASTSLADGSAAAPGSDAGTPSTCTLTCGSACVDGRTDSANCGACGHACTAPNVCVAGVCQSDPEWAAWPVPPDRPTDYAVDGDRVTDGVTGLVWERAMNRTDLTYAQADAYCRALSTGGLTTWRLPTRIELVSLLSTGQGTPLINPGTFAAAPLWRWIVSSSTDPTYSDGTTHYTLSYDSGLTSMHVAADPNGTGVRCVASPAGQERGAHYDVQSETVADLWTGLVWERGGSYIDRDYAGAVSYCQDLTDGGFSDWRLPTRKELETLLTPVAQSSGYHLDGSFDVHYTNHGIYWTASVETIVSDPTWAWTLSFKTGDPATSGQSEGDWAVRCVR